jgi:predicted dehydrogenase
MVHKGKLNVLIIGCGNIAGYFDEQKSKQSMPYTHAGAYVRDGRFNISACVEPNEQRRQAFMKFWVVEHGFSSLDEPIALGSSFDVISLCSPTATHFHDLQKAISLKPKVIFCEKPVTYTIAETEQVIAECEKNNILLLINYTRTWDPTFVQLRADIQAGQWGKLRSIVGTYNKGILNNGSHLINLLYSFVESIDIVGVSQPIFDFFENDPTVSALLESSNGLPIHLVAANAADYAFFELQLIFSQGVLVMEEGGFRWRERKVEESSVFAGYQRLDNGYFQEGSYEQSMLRAVDNIYKAVNDNDTLESTGLSALKVQRLCAAIKQASLCRIKKP